MFATKVTRSLIKTARSQTALKSQINGSMNNRMISTSAPKSDQNRPKFDQKEQSNKSNNSKFSTGLAVAGVFAGAIVASSVLFAEEKKKPAAEHSDSLLDPKEFKKFKLQKVWILTSFTIANF